MERIKISAVLIVKNEEVMLPGCLASLKGQVDEIVVCDTGSTDRTVEIAKEAGATLGFFAWCDDFSAARNYAKSLARNDWILSIDADEVLDTPMPKIPPPPDNILAFKLKLAPMGATTQYHLAIRMFHKRLDWLGPIHEVIAYPNPIEVHDIVIKYGVSPNHEKDPDIDYRILSKNLTSPRNKYYFGRELFYRKDYNKAMEMFNDVVRTSTWRPERADAHLFKAKIFWYTGRGDQARESCLRCIEHTPMCREALFMMSDFTFEPLKSAWLKLAQAADNSDVIFRRM